MTYDVQISSQAEDDLRGIFEYIAFELKSPQNAVKQLSRLEKSINSLEHMPDRYKEYEREPWHNRGLRLMPVDHYIVFYIPNHETKAVTIVRVMYGGRDIDRLISKDTTR